MFALEEYQKEDGSSPFEERLRAIGKVDPRASARIDIALSKMERGLFGDWKSVGRGPIREIRIDHGPGYRIYFVIERKTLVLLLLCGDKRTQSKDIEDAYEYWQDYKSP